MSTTVLLTEHEPATLGLLERQLRDDGFELAPPGCAPDLVLAGNDAELERWRGQVPVIVLRRSIAGRGTPRGLALSKWRACRLPKPRPGAVALAPLALACVAPSRRRASRGRSAQCQREPGRAGGTS